MIEEYKEQRSFSCVIALDSPLLKHIFELYVGDIYQVVADGYNTDYRYIDIYNILLDQNTNIYVTN